MLPRIYVINMKSSVERADKIKQRLDALGLPFEFFDAVCGADLDYKNAPYYDRKRRLRYFGRDLLAGEIGCLLSHRGVYEKMLQDEVETALVLEDDVTLDDDMKTLIERIMVHNRKWDVLRFLGNKKPFSKGFRRLEALDNDHDFVRIPTVPGGAYGYMLTNYAAKALIRHTEKSYFPIDTIHGRVWDTGLDVLALHPSPIYVDQAQDTTIGDARFDKTLQIKGLQRMFYPAFRAWFKWDEGVNKRAAFKRRALKDKLKAESR